MTAVTPPMRPMSHRLPSAAWRRKRRLRRYEIVGKHGEHQNREVGWRITASRSTYAQLNQRGALYKAKRKIECFKAQTRAKVGHPFPLAKRQFGYVKVSFCGLIKNTAQLTTLLALSILWVARKQLMVWVSCA